MWKSEKQWMPSESLRNYWDSIKQVLGQNLNFDMSSTAVCMTVLLVHPVNIPQDERYGIIRSPAVHQISRKVYLMRASYPRNTRTTIVPKFDIYLYFWRTAHLRVELSRAPPV